MKTVNEAVKFFLDMSKVQAVANRRFNAGLGGLGLNEFIILYSLSQVEDGKMRRIDLADRIGLSASGVTRILLPMEKIGLVKSGPAENDARVRCVIIAPGGETKLSEAMERAEMLAEEMIASANIKNVSQISTAIGKFAKSV